MKRMQLVELEDLPWLPAILRDGGTAYLELAERTSGHGKLLVPPLSRALAATGATRIVDLCSGGGGPVRTVVNALAAGGRPTVAVLTDRYPNARAFAHAAEESGGRITGCTERAGARRNEAHLERRHGCGGGEDQEVHASA